MPRYLIVIERAESNFSAYAPDLPGCIAAGETREETLREMQAAIQLHLAGMLEDGIRPPQPAATAEHIGV